MAEPGVSAGWGQPFKEAIEDLRQKISLPTTGWRDIEGWSHDRSFVVAGAAKLVLEKRA